MAASRHWLSRCCTAAQRSQAPTEDIRSGSAPVGVALRLTNGLRKRNGLIAKDSGEVHNCVVADCSSSRTRAVVLRAGLSICHLVLAGIKPNILPVHCSAFSVFNLAMKYSCGTNATGEQKSKSILLGRHLRHNSQTFKLTTPSNHLLQHHRPNQMPRPPTFDLALVIISHTAQSFQDVTTCPKHLQHWPRSRTDPPYPFGTSPSSCESFAPPPCGKTPTKRTNTSRCFGP